MTAASDSTTKHLCFIIGPIGGEGTDIRKHADWLLLGLVRPVLETEEFRYTVKRADEDTRPGMISDRIISDIRDADLIVADLTDLNPNAFYELGICHSREKPVIHIARAGTVLPFDNLGHSTIFVDISDYRSVEKARERLAASAQHINDPKHQVSNPITQANASFQMRDSADPRDQLIADMQSRLQELRPLLTARELLNDLASPNLPISPEDMQVLKNMAEAKRRSKLFENMMSSGAQFGTT
jgi:hypothetical protein